MTTDGRDRVRTLTRYGGMVGTVMAWADGFGTWRVRVPVGLSRQEAHAVARLAILEELEARGAVDPRAVDVVQADPSALDLWREIDPLEGSDDAR